MNIKQIIILLIILVIAFGFIEQNISNAQVESKQQAYYDGVFSGCILLLSKPNLSTTELIKLEQYCLFRTLQARELNLMELYYETPVPPTNLKDTVNY